MQNPESRFLLQVRLNNETAIKELLNNNIRLINVVDDYGTSALLYALKNKNLELAKYLIEKGADIQHVDNMNQDAFGLAKEIGDDEFYNFLVKKNEEKWKEEALKKVQKKYNPFDAYDIDNFLSFELTEQQSKIFGDVNNSEIITAPVESYFGLKNESVNITKTNNTGSNAFTPYTKTKEQIISQIILIDYITEKPTFDKSPDKVIARHNFLRALKDEPIIKRKIDLCTEYGIIYLIDFEIHSLISQIVNV